VAQEEDRVAREESETAAAIFVGVATAALIVAASQGGNDSGHSNGSQSKTKVI
jgi:hypothetical protein